MKPLVWTLLSIPILSLCLCLLGCSPSGPQRLVAEIDQMTAIARTHRGDCPQMQRALSAYLSTRTEAIDELLRQLGDEGEMSERQVDAIGAAMRGFQNATEGCSEARLSIVGLLGPLLEGARR